MTLPLTTNDNDDTISSSGNIKSDICDYILFDDKYEVNPIISIALSCFVIGSIELSVRANIGHNADHYTMYCYGYMVLAISCAIQLYYGLKEGDYKKFLYWMLLKFAETIATLVVLILAYSNHYYGLAYSECALLYCVGGQLLYVRKRIYNPLKPSDTPEPE